MLDTNGNGKLDAWTDPGQPPDPNNDSGWRLGFYAVMPNPADGTVGFPAVSPAGRRDSLRSETKLIEDLQRAAAGLRCARRRHRSQRRRVGVLGSGHSGDSTGASARARSTGQGDRQPLSRGLDVLTIARSRLRTSATTAPSRAITPGLINATRSAWRKRADCHGEPLTACRARRRQVRDAAHPVPARILRQGARRPHRRSDGRLEGQGLVDHEGDRTPWHKEGGKGMTPHGRPYPGPARSSGALAAGKSPPKMLPGANERRATWLSSPHAAMIVESRDCVRGAEHSRSRADI